MPLFDEFDDRLHAAGWVEHFNQNLAAARQFALRVPLLHVVSRRMTLWELLNTSDGSIPTSDQNGYCGPECRLLEQRYGILPSVYFFPGRAHPSHAPDAVIAVPAIEESRFPGDVTFTALYGRLGEIPGLVPEEYFRCSTVRVEPGVCHVVPPWPSWPACLGQGRFARLTRRVLDWFGRRLRATQVPPWRVALACAVAGYFRAVEDWWNGAPARDDPDGLFGVTGRLDWRAWVFEVRTRARVPLRLTRAWAGKRSVLLQLLEESQELEAFSDRRELFDWFTAPGRYLAPDVEGAHYEYGRIMEMWARGESGL